MCDCPIHFEKEINGVCTCVCDHELEKARDAIIDYLIEYLNQASDELVKELASSIVKNRPEGNG